MAGRISRPRILRTLDQLDTAKLTRMESHHRSATVGELLKTEPYYPDLYYSPRVMADCCFVASAYCGMKKGAYRGRWGRPAVKFV